MFSVVQCVEKAELCKIMKSNRLTHHWPKHNELKQALTEGSAINFIRHGEIVFSLITNFGPLNKFRSIEQKVQQAFKSSFHFCVNSAQQVSKLHRDVTETSMLAMGLIEIEKLAMMLDEKCYQFSPKLCTRVINCISAHNCSKFIENFVITSHRKQNENCNAISCCHVSLLVETA